MDGFFKALRRAGVVLAVYAVFFLARAFVLEWRAVRLDTVKPVYLHYEFIELRLRTRDLGLRAKWSASPPSARVTRGGALVPTVAGIREVPLRWDGSKQAWLGRWPCPWNAPDGPYSIELLGPSEEGHRLRSRPFHIVRRVPKHLPPRFAALTWESVRPLASLTVQSPDGTLKDWRGLLDWVEYAGADAFWMLAGQSPGLSKGETWVGHNLALIPEVAKECRRRGLKFGVWAMVTLTMAEEDRVPGYRYALDVDEAGRPKATRAISLADPRRPADVAALLGRYKDLPGVDYLGLDYIRNALGGYELVDEFLQDMPQVPFPPQWLGLSPQERMAAFARKKVARKDMRFIDAWQWWRAHKTSLIIRSIKDELGDDKALWAFTLTWEKGWHHGQDPVMFSDAGVDADALMLYEADSAQFEQMLRDWRGYLRAGDAQLIAGNVVDWPLHQRSPAGAREFGRRLREASRRMYDDGPASGIFIHDLERALHGRLGPHSTREWMEEARSVIRDFKRHPFGGTSRLPPAGGARPGKVPGARPARNPG